MRTLSLLAALGATILIGSTALAENGSGNVGWPSYGNNLGGMRYVASDAINPSNVGKLKPAWILYTGVMGKNTSFETQPIVVGDVMYVTSPRDHAFAVDAQTGAVRWTYTPHMPVLSKLTICCGEDNRGVAVGDGRVFIARLDSKLVALDAATGRELWKTGIANWHHHWTDTAAPLYVDGEVIIGASGGEFGRRGFVAAYDAGTGKQIWRFHTVPGPGKPGHNTWSGSSWRVGGGTVWTTPVADPKLGLLYIATGNAGPDMNGSRRAGDNLYTSSIVALDLKTGKYRWHFQEVHHDLWDYDAAQPPVLFTLRRHGETIPAIGHGNKDGYYFILDRRTGKPLIKVTEQAVPTQPAWQHPAATQPVSPIQLIPHRVMSDPKMIHAAKIWTPPQQKPLLIQPGYEAGPDWPPSAYSPRTHYVYVPAGGYQPWAYHANPAAENVAGSTMVPKIPGVRNYGLFEAVNTATDRIAWRYRSPQKLDSGVAVAGDLVFVGESAGRFDAFDARTGRRLWSYKSSQPGVGGANGAPAVYTVGGREYVAMAFGGNNHVALSSTSPVGDALIAFAVSPSGDSPNIVRAHPGKVPTGAIPPSDMVPPLHVAPPGVRVVTVKTHDFRFYPDRIEAKPGERLAVHIVNVGLPPSGIAFKLPSGPLALKGKVKPRHSAYMEMTAPARPGHYRFFSPLPNQKNFGMVGQLIVGGGS